MGRSAVGHHVCSCKTTVLFTFSMPPHPPPLTPLWEPNHTHTTEHNSKHTCSITTKPLSVFTQLHPKAPTGISIALSLQAHESSNTLGFAATAYIRLYLTHIMAVRKRKIRTFYRSNGKFQLLDALIEVG